jgi:hypothetical protein
MSRGPKGEKRPADVIGNAVPTRHGLLKICAIAACLAVVISAESANAEMTANEAISHYKAHDQQAILFTKGIEIGISMSNIYLTDQKRPLYCEPHSLVLATDQIFDILERYTKGTPGVTGGLPLSTVLFFALMDAFPCKNSN